MNESNELFSPDCPIGRLWYYINLVAWGFISIGVNIGFTEYIIPQAKDDFKMPVQFMLKIIYFILFVTLFMLIDRRILSISGSRDEYSYRLLSKISGLFFFIIIVVCLLFGIAHFINFSIPDKFFKYIKVICIAFTLFIFIIGLIPRKKTY